MGATTTPPSVSGLYLGQPLSSATASSLAMGIYTAIVNVPSHELPSMNFITPGDLATSYIMHKMDGDMCQFDTMCTTMLTPAPVAPCGVVMPQATCALDDPTHPRDKVRRWIAQGAKNN
jgi:hypothetical protein